MTESTEVGVSGNSLEAIIRKYLTDHSARRLNYLYWNLTDAKDMTLSFVNLTGKKLNRINNGELVYRIVRIKDANDWAALSDFINRYIVDPEDARAVYVIRVDFLSTYLKAINFDPSQIDLTRVGFGTAYCFNDDDKKRKPICTVDNDIQSLYLIDRLYGKYRKMLYSDSPEWEITDITDAFINDDDFKFVIKDLNVTIPVADALDVVAKRYIKAYKTTEAVRLDQIYTRSGLSTVASRLTCPDLGIVSVRAYIQIFLKKYIKDNGKNNGKQN